MAALTKKQQILGVMYEHLDLGEKGDLYVTDFGLPYIDCLMPDNHLRDKQWFRNNAVRLSGTSTVYRISSKEVDGRQHDLVTKWNRMGQDIAVPAHDGLLADAEFNSPFEEFSLLMELRERARQKQVRLATHHPLAIYVPREHFELWRTGRKQYKMEEVIEKHADIELDMHRQYATLYEWVDGIDASEAFREQIIPEEQMRDLTLEYDARMSELGFYVGDRKPHHLIVRPQSDNSLALDADGDTAVTLIDFELLARTPEHEQEIRKVKRSEYLKRQRDRFAIPTPKVMPSYLERMKIHNVDYIYGQAESTGGGLWVVGKDPDLFEYFLPERWEGTPRTRMSAFSEIYHTVTKDNVKLVWKVSHVGLIPDVDPFQEGQQRVMEFGYNSPFEEFALAVKLGKAGIPTTYPRAIYMMGNRTEISENLFDPQRYASHVGIQNMAGLPVLQQDRDYVMIWGFWNGPDELLAESDQDYYDGVNALRAYREGLLNEQAYIDVMQYARNRLLDVHVEDMNLTGTHLILSIDRNNGQLVRDDNKQPEFRVCNFELLRELD